MLARNLKNPLMSKDPLAMVDKQSLILVRKQHIELKSDQKAKDRAMLKKSVVVKEQKRSLIDDHGWLEKNSEDIKK
jgi:hypothetical protein